MRHVGLALNERAKMREMECVEALEGAGAGMRGCGLRTLLTTSQQFVGHLLQTTYRVCSV